MAHSPAVLLLDDGELDDVKEILEDADVAYGRVRGGAIVPDTPCPSKLLVSTPRRIGAVSLPEPGSPEAEGLFRIVVVSEDSTTLREQMREVGFDYLVRRPVHLEALRLLLLHCLYTGEEKRSEPRVPAGFEVSFRTGLLPRRVTLVDLSTGGCRLLSKWALEPGKSITVTIPQRVGIAEPISLKGRVIRMSLDERLGPEGPYSAAVAFGPLAAETRQELERVLEEQARGPATLKQAADSSEKEDDKKVEKVEPCAPGSSYVDLASGFSVEVDVRLDPLLATPDAFSTAALASADEPEPLREEAPDDRRSSRRGSYPHRVPAFGDRAMRVLVARDLSRGGMRIEEDTGVEIGDRLHLAIYGAADAEPFLVWATVDRDDGEGGMALVFDDVDPEIAEQLEKIVADLPAVESLHDDEARAMGTVISEILDG
jgi:hypothetical protein